MNSYNIIEKSEKVLDSCRTISQVDIAARYLSLANKKLKKESSNKLWLFESKFAPYIGMNYFYSGREFWIMRASK